MRLKVKNNGFTLVEVLIAVTIFGIVVTSLYGSFNLIISNVNPINSSLDDYEMARSAMDRITQDLNALYVSPLNIYSPPDIETENVMDMFRFLSQPFEIGAGSFSQLRFASFEHISFMRNQKPGIGVLKYYVDISESGDFLLKRSDIGLAFYSEDTKDNFNNDPILCERLLEFKLEFTDQDGEQHEVWDSDSPDFAFASPYSIYIKLVIGDKTRPNVFTTTIVLPVKREKNES